MRRPFLAAAAAAALIPAGSATAQLGSFNPSPVPRRPW